jgi:hypothetical protein
MLFRWDKSLSSLVFKAPTTWMAGDNIIGCRQPTWQIANNKSRDIREFPEIFGAKDRLMPTTLVVPGQRDHLKHW